MWVWNGGGINLLYSLNVLDVLNTIFPSIKSSDLRSNLFKQIVDKTKLYLFFFLAVCYDDDNKKF